MARARLVPIGRVGRPQGVKGDVRVHPAGDLSQGLDRYTRFYLGSDAEGAGDARPIDVAAHRVQGRFLVVRFAGFDTPEEARKLLHRLLYVERQEMPPLEEDEYYYADLLGCRVLDEAGEELGRVTDVFATAAHDVLVLETGGREWMIPIVSEHVTEIDAPRGEIRVQGVGGLRP